MTEGGLTHAVNFQMGEYPIGEHYVVPGWRESVYGKFAVNLGVFLPCVYAAEWPGPAPAFISEAVCRIRDRLRTTPNGREVWFEIKSDTDALSKTLVRAFDQYGLPFLDRFRTYEDVLTYFEEHGDLPSSNETRATFEAGLIAHHLGDLEMARKYLSKAASSWHKGFNEHVTEIANRLKIDLD